MFSSFYGVRSVQIGRRQPHLAPCDWNSTCCDFHATCHIIQSCEIPAPSISWTELYPVKAGFIGPAVDMHITGSSFACAVDADQLADIGKARAGNAGVIGAGLQIVTVPAHGRPTY